MVDDPKAVLNGVGREAVAFVFQNYKKLALYAAALSLIEIIFWLLLPAGALTEIVQFLVSTYLYAVFAIMIHRWILLDEVALKARYNKRVLYFVGMIIAEVIVLTLVGVAVFVPVMLVIGLFFSFGVGGFVPVVLMTVGAAAIAACAVFIIARLIAVFPNLAVTKPEKLSLDTILLSIALSKGATLEIGKRLVVFFLGAFLVLLPIDWLASVVLAEMSDGIGQRALLSPVAYLYMLLAYAPIPFFVALASFVYRRLVDDLQRKKEEA